MNDLKMKPILFSTPMVQAILDGRKTQTRRTVKENTDHFVNVQSLIDENRIERFIPFVRGAGAQLWADPEIKPKYQIGDILWVRETSYTDYEGIIHYKTDADSFNYKGLWKPSIFMPKEAARIFLKVTNDRIEKLQDISEDDAINEGIENFFSNDKSIGATAYRNYLATKKDLRTDHFAHVADNPIHSFQTLWQSINGIESWNDNPFVWVYEFEEVNINTIK